MALTPENYTTLRSVDKDFQLWFAKGPIHVPHVYKLTDGDDGNGHLVTAYQPVPVLGPPLRLVALGDTLNIYGGDSYIHGGAAASGHTWGVYHYNAATDNEYIANRGSSMSSGFTTIDGGKTLVFTPTTAAGYTEGIYAIELHLTGATEGNGITAPLGFGVRFVYVVPKDADGIYRSPLEGVVSTQVTGGFDKMGWEALCKYALPDDIMESLSLAVTPFDLNQRIVARYETYYDGVTWTWEPDNDFPLGYYSPEIFFSGYLASKTFGENTTDSTFDFTVRGAQHILDLLQIPTLPKQIPKKIQGEAGEQEQLPTMFISEQWYDLLLVPVFTEAPDLPRWIHRHEDMVFSDPLYHFLTRHTNFCDFHDFRLWQADTDKIEDVIQQEGGTLAWVNQVNTARMGVQWSDRKSKFYVGPDLNLRGADYWASAPGIASAVIDLDASLYTNVSIQYKIPTTGQVELNTVDGVKVLEQLVQSKFGKAPADLQQFMRNMRRATYPPVATNGQRIQKQSVVFYDQEILEVLAKRLYKKENMQFPSVNVTVPLLPGLDLGQSVRLLFNPRSQEPNVKWANGKMFYVVGYSMTPAINGTDWTTVYTLTEITDNPEDEGI